MPNETISIQDNNEIIELTGEALIAFNSQRKKDAEELKKQQAEADAKIAARESALAKLASLGLTQEEIDAL